MYGTNICVGESLYHDTKDAFVFRFLDTIKAKGKNNSSKIYELVGARSNVSEAKLHMIRKFESTLGLYYKKEFEQARAAFYEIFLESGDKTSKIFAERCEKFIITPPQEDWDGTYSATEK